MKSVGTINDLERTQRFLVQTNPAVGTYSINNVSDITSVAFMPILWSLIPRIFIDLDSTLSLTSTFQPGSTWTRPRKLPARIQS